LIRPGEVNWMTAGRGIAHSERTPRESRRGESELFGVQSWVALPTNLEESEPAFAHHDAGELPSVEGEGKTLRLIAGSLYGARSPVRTLSEMFYAEALLAPGAALEVPAEHEERAAYVVEGSVELMPEREVFAAGQLLVFRPGAEVVLRSPGGGRAAPHLVELRLKLRRAHRAGEGGLAGGALLARARRVGVHPAARRPGRRQVSLTGTSRERATR
jgi:redox-sensitive bicupin YhaK (pirin superfamily)